MAEAPFPFAGCALSCLSYPPALQRCHGSLEATILKLSLLSRFVSPPRVPTPQGYVHAIRIDGLDDPFDAEDLWTAPRMAYTTESVRLRQALESHPERRQGRKTQQVFSHVQVVLPNATVVRDRRASRSSAAQAMVQRLVQLHREDFGDRLGALPVRYMLTGADDVPDGSALVRFGLGIYVPREGTRLTVCAGEDRATDQSHGTRCCLEVSVDGGVIFRSVGEVHRDERLVVLGADLLRATHAIPAWPFSPDHLLIAVNESGKPMELGAEPYGSLSVLPGTREGESIVAQSGVDSQIPPLVLRVVGDRPDAVSPGASAVPQVPGKVPAASNLPTGRDVGSTTAPLDAPAAAQRSESEMRDADMTYVAARASRAPGDSGNQARTFVPQSPQRLPKLVLAGLVLQRVSLYEAFGVAGLRVAFDTRLRPVSSDQASWLRLEVDAIDRLTVSTRSGSQAIELPSSFSHRGQTLEARVPPQGLQAHWVALLLHDFGVSEAIPSGMPLVTGRGQRLLSTLRVIDGLGCVVRGESESASSDDQMGLSRRAFTLEVDGRSLKVAQLAPTQRLFHLDEHMDLVAELNGAARDTAVLNPGQYLAASHYLWQFQAP